MIETRTAIIKLIKEDLICIRFKPDCFLELEHLIENRKAIFELIKDKKVYILSIPFNDTLISNDFRETFAQADATEFKKGEAIVITTLPQNILANFIKKNSKTNISH